MHGLLHQQVEQAASSQQPALLIGAVADDFSDYRPGLQAAREAGARWPLADAGMDKAMVRWLSQQRGLATWDRPAEPCLSSRIPYGERVNPEKLRMIEAAELVLKEAGFIECRARHHEIGHQSNAQPALAQSPTPSPAPLPALCRIEIPTVDLPRAVAQAEHLTQAIRQVGYRQVTIDLAGMQSGGFNKLLS